MPISPHLPPSSFLLVLLFFSSSSTSIIATTSSSSSASAADSFVFGGCSQLKFPPASPYEANVNSLLTSLLNSAAFSNYNNFTVPASSSSSSQDTLYGLFQCRGDLAAAECSRCVSRAVARLGALCPGACGGALQLHGCFVKYDNATFLGVEDKAEVMRKCGPSIGLTSDALTARDAVLANLGASDGGFRITSSGDVQGVAQCVGDLSAGECGDCVSDAIQRLRMECGAGAWGEMYLAKCYARYFQRGYHSPTGNDDDSSRNDEEVEKTLAILLGLIAGAHTKFTVR
ncbi:cysteine-rich repeat secretory protein 12 [Senna tora]|uniref:Cysteine-rich repeat secretory protein 12 n=1 Tax=Senna tora TaxID=362788 RepID=A0A834TSG0_9FABA|nr:cysteine-rich repeat secretory protein 12 [Senna tora]